MTTSYSYFNDKGESHNNFGRWYKDGYKKLVEDKSYISFLEKNNVKPSRFEIDESANSSSSRHSLLQQRMDIYPTF